MSATTEKDRTKIQNGKKQRIKILTFNCLKVYKKDYGQIDEILLRVRC